MRDTHRTRIAVAERGVSLVEILVGLAIGLIGVLIMFQTVSVWDARSRSSTSTSDAQVAGSLAMFALERDIRGAGEGFGTAPAVDMGCTVTGFDMNGNPLNTNVSLGPVVSLRPVEITALAGQPNQIKVLYGDSAFFVNTQVFNGSTLTNKQALRLGGFKPGDLVVVAGNDTGLPGSATCQLVQVTRNPDPSNNAAFEHMNGGYTNFYSGAASVAKVNPTGGTPVLFTTGNLFNLGPGARYKVWTVDLPTSTLNSQDLIQGTPPSPVAESVVDLKAEYGVDTDGDGEINGPPEWFPATAAPPADWTMVRAIRVGILVRSRNWEKPAASAADASYQLASAPTWSGSATSPFVMHNVDGTPDTNPAGSPNNWRLYRYRVYEKVIPLRNMVWGTSP
jgi:type IV pilus assembly protein PilW